MKTMTVAVQILGMEVTSIFLDGLVKDPSWKELQYLREDIFASIHNFELEIATKLGKRSLQIMNKHIFRV